MSDRSSKLYLEDICDAIQKIKKYTNGMSFEEFEEDAKTVDAVIRNLEVIGEAVNNLPQGFRDKNLEVPWRKIISMRNKMIHEYFGVDLEIVWKTIKEDILSFASEIDKIEE